MVVKKRKIVKTETIIEKERPNISVSEKKIITTTKKRKRKKSSAKKNISKPASKSDIQVEKLLIENFVSLQKVMTTMAGKFDSLSTQMSKLLELFELSAKSLAEKGFSTGEDKKILDKLDSLLEQNRTFAKGIAMLHEREKEEPEEVMMPSRPLQRTPPAYSPTMPAMKKVVKTEYHEPVSEVSEDLSENPSFEEGM
jgi:hypothetical protein